MTGIIEEFALALQDQLGNQTAVSSTAMVSGTQFVARLQAATSKVAGRLVAACLIQSQLKRNLITAQACSPADCKKLVSCTVEAIGLFATKEETRKLQLELEALYRSSFPSS